MKRISCFLILLAIGCTDKVSGDDLVDLNGYWEIEKVVFPDGNIKEYSVNTSIDYIYLEGKKGYRKKVQPKFDGTFRTSNDADPFVVVELEDGFSIHYDIENGDNRKGQRSELLVGLAKDRFSVTNIDGITYCYKRFTSTITER